jgi:hypothetical protein
MASHSAPPCPHELRPGTAVCLRCQHAERGVKRARQRQMFARGGAAALSLAVIAAVGIAAATAIRSRGWTKAPATAPREAATDGAVDSTVIASDSAPDSDQSNSAPAGQPAGPDMVVKGNSSGDAPVASSGAMPAPPSTTPVTSSASLTMSRAVAPVVPVGRTALRDTMVAERAGDTVRVSFDLLLSRTRRAEKFEAIVRSTLPQVYGALADSALRALPVGAVARAGDLMTTLPERGFHIPIAGGRTIAVWPETRAGRDGPLVVAYRAVASR